MGLFNYFKNKKKEQLPLIARVNLDELKKQKEEQIKNSEVSILGAENYSKHLPKIRLCYIACNKIDQNDTNESHLEIIYYATRHFCLPKHMELNDAYKVISYLTEKIAKNNHIKQPSAKCVEVVGNFLCRYGFEVIDNELHGPVYSVKPYKPFVNIKIASSISPISKKSENSIDLFSIGGDAKIFQRTDMYNKYTPWYIQGVTKQEIEDIYKKINKQNLVSHKIEEIGKE